jgi:ribonuclease BN (tRNA processing enzyme)
MAQVDKLVLMHFSPRYHHDIEALLREAQEEFGRGVSY